MGEIRDFVVPDLGEGLESGEIVAWHVDVGDHVELNQDICELETAKATVSVPCPFAGTVVERFGEVGEELAVGEPLVRIDVEDVAAAADVPEGVDDQLEVADEAASADSEAGPEAGAEDDAADDAHDTDVLVGYGAAAGSATRRRRNATRKQPTGPGGDGDAASASRSQRPLAPPPVRKLAKDLGVDLAAIAPGSGKGGIVTRDDVRAAAQAAAGAPEAQQAPEAVVPHTGVAAADLGFRGRAPGDVIALSGIRKRIAEKMIRSRTTIPHASASVTVDCTATWELADRLTRSARSEGHSGRITAFAVMARATVLALRRFPILNAFLDEDADEIRLLEGIHLGVAVDTDRGLLVPVVRDAHRRSTLRLARELTRLAAAARDGSIRPEELTGGTFTVNNYGSLGNDIADPIVNHPEAAILGVGATKERPWVVDGALAVRRTVTLTVAFDHRIADGGDAGRFVSYVGELVEEPSRILLHS
ncbi:MAG: 2-oxo acid dehydrogenase subunit E2 [Actinobacteria bacterium]|nr:2-oxo acid dehydrogenase subunit E2 [Actinomycetota bacterium]